MRKKLRAILLAAFALAVLAVVPASASATTLTANSSALQIPATIADFQDGATYVGTGLGSYNCDEFTLGTSITQNEADPITLELTSANIDGCLTSSGLTIDYSDIELTSAMTLNADGTGAIPLRLTETWTSPNWSGSVSCVREGVLDVTFDTTNQYGNVTYDGNLVRVSGGSFCPVNSSWDGWFDSVTDDFGTPIEWVVTP
jgi:hypothetical protein